MMTREEKRGWWIIGGVNALALLWALGCLLIFGCAPCPEIVARVTVAVDGGEATAAPAAPVCAVECTTDADCARGVCSPICSGSQCHPGDPGLCDDSLSKPDGGR